MKTSVVIVNYNTSQQVIACIKSLAGEPLQKIVVVDNASPNDHPEDITDAFPDVVLIKHPKNCGFGDGCNVGSSWILKNTDSEFIFFLNPDTIIEPGLISLLEAPFVNTKIGVTAPRITMMDSGMLWYGGGYVSWLKGSARVPGYAQRSDASLAMLERDVQFVSGCAFMARRSVLEQCGGFDARYFMYEEDVELSLRVLANGYLLRYIPQALVHHIGQGSQGEAVQSVGMFSAHNPKLPFFVYYAARNRFLTVFKHGNGIQCVLFLAGFTVWFAREGMGWLRYGRFDAFRALLNGLKDFFPLKR